MKLKNQIGLVAFVAMCVIVTPVTSTAEKVSASTWQAAFPTKGLEGRIEFWRLIFTRYGKNQIVVHHRAHPHIIYSVLDFTSFEKRYSGRTLASEKERVIKAELEKIKATLGWLGQGKAPRNEFEQRVQQMFRSLPGGSKKYRLAADSKQLRTQTGIKERFRDGIHRSGRFLPAIEEIFHREGLPLEIARLPLVESSFDYDAYSAKGAAGIWQFMRSTGKQYMRVSASIDERRDPLIASRAAAKYLSNAYSRLQSWPLAITSYNYGLTGMLRAVRETGSKDLPLIIEKYEGRTWGFATQNFYSEFIAALDVEQNWRKYFPTLEREREWRIDEVRIDRSMSYSDLVRTSGLSSEEFQKLNPALMRPVRNNQVRVPTGFVVNLPAGKGETFRRGTVLIAAASGSASDSTREGLSSGYRVKQGDTLGEIARRFGVSTAELMAANQIKNAHLLRVGQHLVIPGVPGGMADYTVEPGDTLIEIASRSGISLESLRALNPEVESTIHPGQKLKIAGRGASPAASENRYYTVQAGDNLTLIAKKAGISLQELKKLNPNVSTLIKPGQKLVIR